MKRGVFFNQYFPVEPRARIEIEAIAIQR